MTCDCYIKTWIFYQLPCWILSCPECELPPMFHLICQALLTYLVWGTRVDEKFFGKPSTSFCFQLFIAISWLFQSLIRSIMAIVLQLSGKSLQVEEGTMPLIQQSHPSRPNRKAARNYNQTGDSSGEWGCFQDRISEDSLASELRIKSNVEAKYKEPAYTQEKLLSAIW